MPAEFLKNNTRSRGGLPSVRSVQQQAFTVTASHPLVWCDREGTTARCLTVVESAVLMGVPPDWVLPSGSQPDLGPL